MLPSAMCLKIQTLQTVQARVSHSQFWHDSGEESESGVCVCACDCIASPTHKTGHIDYMQSEALAALVHSFETGFAHSLSVMPQIWRPHMPKVRSAWFH